MQCYITPDEITQRAFLHHTGLQNTGEHPTKKEKKIIYIHFGASPEVLAEMWNDLMDKEGELTIELTEAGLRMFFAAIYFLWVYSKNATILATTFGIKKWRVTGQNFWDWIRVIASLKEQKIIWPEGRYSDVNAPIFIISVDGTDFKTWEKKHPLYPVDKGEYSFKYNHGARRVEVGLDVYSSNLVWLSGPHRGAKHDKTIFIQEGGLLDKIPDGKKAIADSGYGSITNPNQTRKVALPNPCDDKALAKFKTRVRLRHETFNSRLKHYQCL